jgi:hypothetical protein
MIPERDIDITCLATETFYEPSEEGREVAD